MKPWCGDNDERVSLRRREGGGYFVKGVEKVWYCNEAVATVRGGG